MYVCKCHQVMNDFPRVQRVIKYNNRGTGLGQMVSKVKKVPIEILNGISLNLSLYCTDPSEMKSFKLFSYFTPNLVIFNHILLSNFILSLSLKWSCIRCNIYKRFPFTLLFRWLNYLLDGHVSRILMDFPETCYFRLYSSRNVTATDSQFKKRHWD